MRFKMPILRRIDTKDTEGIDAAVADGFEFIGTLKSYSLSISDDHFPVEIREAWKADYEGMLDIVLAEMRHSRIYADCKIPFEEAQTVYRDRVKLAFSVGTVFRDDSSEERATRSQPSVVKEANTIESATSTCTINRDRLCG